MSSHFLYERWLATSHAFAGEIALFDLASDKSWTFAQLRRESEQLEKTSAPLAFPCGSDPGFILSVLNAWRDRSVTCPLEAGQSAQHIPNPAADIAHLKLTSATSGVSKCIAFTGPQLAADADNIMQTMGLTVESPNLSCISLAHSYGFSNLVLPLLLHGVPLVLVPAPLPELLMRAAKPFRSISLPAVPALWKTWYVSKSIPPNTRIAISAGAPLPLELEQTVFEESNLKIHNFYGSSECGGIAYDRTNFPRAAANCVGSALTNVTLSISSAGNLVIESAAVGQTYLPEPQP
ncbi:MAG TPA: AMP-binding protein, partial [Candidatus Kapabacteria bacterium]|nr:AMP-binding protein [Candidatus Kapabacteria bacterium]